MQDAVIGLDIGTSSVKAAGFDLHGRLLGSASMPIDLQYPKPGWVEQSPEDWWNAACEVLNSVARKLDNFHITSVGLCGQCPSHVLVSGKGESIGSAIIWRDQRAMEESAWLKANISPDLARKWVGSAFVPDPTSPPARLLWLKKNRPEDWRQAAAVLQPKDFIALKLTDQVGTDKHSAYLLANAEESQYHPEYFAALGITVEKLPRVMTPMEVIGAITASACSLTGLPIGTPIVIGTIDAYCDNLAGGILSPGQVVDVAGTSESVSLSVEQLMDCEGVFSAYIEGGGAFLCGPTQAGGDTLRWLYNCFYREGSTQVDFSKMEAEAQAAQPGSGNLVFLPYLNGERAPLWDANASGAFIGLTFEHDRRHCTRAVYEGIGFAIRHIVEVAEAAAGIKSKEMVICGGGSLSRFWNRIKADILQRPVRTTAVTETGCLGAAMLASVGIGLYANLKESCDHMVTYSDLITHNPALAEVYQTSYQIYRASYPSLRPVMALRTG